MSAKEVQRITGVTYKTAWRMCNEIRKYMGWVDGDVAVGGPGRPAVEIDKTFIGGRDKRGAEDKTVVLGMAEREGDILTRIIPDRTSKQILPARSRVGAPLALASMTDKIKPTRSWISSGVPRYRHAAVNHQAKEYVPR